MEVRNKNSFSFFSKFVPYLFILPSLIGVLMFMIIPTLSVFGLSLFNWDLLSPPSFAGFNNYIKLFTDNAALHSLYVTTLYVLMNIPLQIGLAIALALVMNFKLRGIGLLRALFILPWLATPVAISIVWQWILDPNFGVLNEFLSSLHLPKLEWLTSQKLALPSIVMINLWQWTGYLSLFFLAGLQNIPTYLYQAADIDGAGRLRKFYSITFPLLQPTLFFVLITCVIGAFQVFDTVYIITQGGPGYATNVFNFYIFQQGFQFFQMGYASALAVVLFAIILFVTFMQILYFRKRIVYDLS